MNIVFAFLLGLVAGACGNAEEKNSHEGSILIQNGALSHNSRSVSLTIVSSKHDTVMKISEEDTFSNIDWQTIQSSTTYTFDSDGTKILYVKFADEKQSEGSTYSSEPITIDSTAPSFAVSSSYSIRNPSVVISIEASDSSAMQMKIASEADFEGAAWEEFSTTKTVPYAKKILVQLKDALDLVTEIVSVQPSYTATLSQARYDLLSTTAGTKAIFVGGEALTGVSDVVDIYDSTLNSWSATTLSVGRTKFAAVSLGEKAFFAGGRIAGMWGTVTNSVEIYDGATGLWSTSALSVARQNLAGTAVGTKVIFAGGYASGHSNVVDIYDVTTNTWTTTTLSQARSNLVAVTVGSKALFACGDSVSNVVDIYDSTTGTWSTATLSVARTSLSVASSGGKAFFAGGSSAGPVDTAVVDVYDSVANSWSTLTLSSARHATAATAVGGKVIFSGGGHQTSPFNSGVIDIYDTVTNSWSTAAQVESLFQHTGTSVGTKAIFAGGTSPDGSGSRFSDRVEIFDSETGAWTTSL